MDNLTHGLVGYTIYKLTAPSQTQDKKSERRLLWASVLASELPDADMVSAFWGIGASLEWHRGFTHSLAGVVALTAGAFFLVRRVWPALPPARLLGLLFAAMGLHSFFDLLTSYGTKILLPWRSTPFAWDILPIVDPYLLIILAGILWSGYRNSRKTIIWGLAILMAGYIGWRVQLHSDAVAQVQAALPAAREVIATPVIGGIKSWRFTARLPQGFSSGRVELGGEVATEVFIPDISNNPVIQAAAASKTMALYRGFARMTAYRLEREEALWHVTVLDPRYAMPGRTMFTGHVWLDARLNIVGDDIIQR